MFDGLKKPYNKYTTWFTMVYGRYIVSMVSKPRNKTGGTPQIIDVTLWQSPDSSALLFRGGTGIKKNSTTSGGF